MLPNVPAPLKWGFVVAPVFWLEARHLLTTSYKNKLDRFDVGHSAVLNSQFSPLIILILSHEKP